MLARFVIALSVSMAVSIAVSSTFAYAAADQADDKAKKETPNFKVDPTSLRGQLLSSEVPVIHSLLQVYSANDQLSQAKANLLPSFGAGNASNGLFSLGWVSATLPFLMPSNWATMNSQESSLAASGYAYQIAELNEYLTVFQLYLDTLADHKVVKVYKDEVNVIDSIIKKSQSQNSDVAEIMQKEQDIRAAIIPVQMNLVGEIATLRKMLGLQENINFEFSDYQTAPFDFEGDATATNESRLAKKAFLLAPEKKQTDELIQANHQDGISQGFGFFNGASVSPTVANNGVNMNGTTVAASGNFSFGILPQLKMNRDNELNLQMNLVDLQREYLRIFETDLQTLELIKQKLALAETDYQTAVAKFYATDEISGGTKELMSKAVQLVSDYTDKSVAKIRTQTSLNHLRVDLARRLVKREFAAIPTCNLQNKKVNHLTSIFNSQPDVTGIDQLCRNGVKLKIDR